MNFVVLRLGCLSCWALLLTHFLGNYLVSKPFHISTRRTKRQTNQEYDHNTWQNGICSINFLFVITWDPIIYNHARKNTEWHKHRNTKDNEPHFINLQTDMKIVKRRKKFYIIIIISKQKNKYLCVITLTRYELKYRLMIKVRYILFNLDIASQKLWSSVDISILTPPKLIF